MSEEIEYKEGDHLEFIQYLFSDSPKPQGAITLELPLSEPNKNVGLHVFEQLLMIFVDGLKYFHGDENQKVNVIKVKTDNKNHTIELLEPSDSSSVVRKFIDKRGEGLHHIALEVDDIENAISYLKNNNIKSKTKKSSKII